MIERKTFTYDGQNSADFGLYIAGDSVYDAPTRDMNMITIPGRNGQLSIDQGRFENITVTYPAFIWADTQAEFRTKVRAIRNWLCPKHSYYRLTDEYNPEYFRLGIYKSGLEVEPIFYNRAGRFELSFDCKPQRFLFSGEEVFTLGEWGETETYSGSIVSFDGTETTAIKSLKVNITPKQSGTGDPSPSNVRPISGWEGVNVTRCGKNLLVTQPTMAYYFTFDKSQATFVKAGTQYRYSFESVSGATSWRTVLNVWDVNGNKIAETTSDINQQNAFTADPARFYATKLSNPYYVEMGNGTYKSFIFTFNQDCYVMIGIYFGDTSASTVVNNAQLELGNATTYEPYNGTSYPISLGQTVYGGTLDVVSGKLKKYPYYSSYNGETLSGRWICDRAVYSQGTTPPNGSQVVDMSGQGTELTLTPTEVKTLLGQNNIWADAGTVEVEIGENPNILVNPTPFTAQPVFEVEGSGTLAVNNSSMTIANNGTTIIDSEMMEAYEEENGAIVSRNDMVSGEFPTLKEGNNNIGTVGLTSVKVTPKWYEV